MSNDKLHASYSIPGPGGSLGKCALCGETFLKEILLGETVATVHCDALKGNPVLPMHHECADKVAGIKSAKDLLPGPLRSAFASVLIAHGETP